MVLDLSKCYYRFRTVEPLYVKVGNKIFRSQRMLFGINCGPGALEEATHHFDEVLRKCSTGSTVKYHAWYYDDISLVGQNLLQHAESLSTYAHVLGWDFPPSKRSSLKNENGVTPWVQHLGYLLRLGEEGDLQLRCQAKALPDSVRRTLTSVI